MKTRRMVQALYDLLGCDYQEYNLRGGGGATVREHYRPGLLEANTKEHEGTAARLAALMNYLGLEAREFPSGFWIVKTKKTKGTKRA